jgi:hypothetical protein
MVDRNVRGSKRAFNVWRLAFGVWRLAFGGRRAGRDDERAALAGVGGRVSGLVVRLGFGER